MKDLAEKQTQEENYVHLWGKNIPGGGNRSCKDPEAGTGLKWLRTTCMAGAK